MKRLKGNKVLKDGVIKRKKKETEYIRYICLYSTPIYKVIMTSGNTNVMSKFEPTNLESILGGGF